MTVGRSDMSKFTDGSWQGLFTVNHVTAVQTLKLSSIQKMLSENSFKAGICLYICRLVFQCLPIAADVLPHILQSS